MKYVAFLRGINVGGKTIIKMEDLRRVLTDAGLNDVRSYIQSGNILFDSEETDEHKLVALIADAVASNFFPTPVMLRSVAEIADAVANNPFANEDFSEKLFHLVMLHAPLDETKTELLLAQNSATETYAVRGRDVYCFLRDGTAKSALGRNFFGSRLKTDATARNWRTMKTMLEL